MLFLSKETSKKDENIKMQMMVLMKDDKGESSTEHMWKENGFFGDQRTDLIIVKANFPENKSTLTMAVLLQSRVAMQCILILLSWFKFYL